jgi:hypothetical protein
MEQPKPKGLAIRPQSQASRPSLLHSPSTPNGAAAKLTIDQSPLTQQARPDVFEPKIVGLYNVLFKVKASKSTLNLSCLTTSQNVDDDEKSEGFWREFFLLQPDTVRLRQILENVDGEGLIHAEVLRGFHILPT